MRGWRDRTIRLDTAAVKADWFIFKDLDIQVGNLSMWKNRYGDLGYVTFRVSDKIHCVAFRQFAGSLVSDTAANWATTIIQGFYCGETGGPISESDAREILSSYVIQVKGSEQL